MTHTIKCLATSPASPCKSRRPRLDSELLARPRHAAMNSDSASSTPAPHSASPVPTRPDDAAQTASAETHHRESPARSSSLATGRAPGDRSVFTSLPATEPREVRQTYTAQRLYPAPDCEPTDGYIDYHKLLDPDTPAGRMCAFTTRYRFEGHFNDGRDGTEARGIFLALIYQQRRRTWGPRGSPAITYPNIPGSPLCRHHVETSRGVCREPSCPPRLPRTQADVSSKGTSTAK